MIGLLCFVLAVLAAPIKSKMRLEAENAVLRHQLTVLRRRLQGRVRLTNKDRRLLIVLYRWFPSILQVLTPQGRPPDRPAPPSARSLS
jgi:type II secretory pathway pseudopilin PulG